MLPTSTECSAPAALPNSDGNIFKKFNPFSIDESSSYQDSASHETSAPTNYYGQDSLKNIQATITSNHVSIILFELVYADKKDQPFSLGNLKFNMVLLTFFHND